MTNPFKRGSAPGRAQPAYLRPDSFKHGHKKLGGRKRGTPNFFSFDYKNAILEAAYRIGNDGNGKDGLVGYFAWVAERHPQIFCTVLLTNLLPLENAESDAPKTPRRTIEEINQVISSSINLAGKNRMDEQNVQVDCPLPWDWTGQPFPVGTLMQLAVGSPKAFCTLVVAGFLRPATKPRRPAARDRSWPQAGAPSASR